VFYISFSNEDQFTHLSSQMSGVLSSDLQVVLKSVIKYNFFRKNDLNQISPTVSYDMRRYLEESNGMNIDHQLYLFSLKKIFARVNILII